MTKANIERMFDLPINTLEHVSLLAIMALGADRHGRGCRMSVPTMATRLRRSPRRTQEYLAELEEAGWIRPGDQSLADKYGMNATRVWDIALTEVQAQKWREMGLHPLSVEIRKGGRLGGKASSARRTGLTGGAAMGATEGATEGAMRRTQIKNLEPHEEQLTREVLRTSRADRLVGADETGDPLPHHVFEPEHSAPVPSQRRSAPDEGPGGPIPDLWLEESVPGAQKRPQSGKDLSRLFKDRLLDVRPMAGHDAASFAPALNVRMKRDGVAPEVVAQMIEAFFGDTRRIANHTGPKHLWRVFLGSWEELHGRVTSAEVSYTRLSDEERSEERRKLDPNRSLF